ncbi:MAG: universal stress protein [Gammaproteobacteria bacterium]|nr:universal stress protein [Gammaproteobacteria bacterium]MBU6509619.1 universal stress protein [Gammaproteobacteria bacterium]MDE1983725.1 universal stress protein [Gammaproteobacteria bacterium]MDE2108476.1 universal stress protein [Gammaproteobacteria bacterium]MDE2461110.1 universal stress protein [Gammaproteobacteria bacterium]
MLYENIVLAYDGSLTGQRALREGAELAARFKAHTHLLAVIKHSTGVAIGQGFEGRSLAAAEASHFQQTLDEGVAILKRFGLEASGHLVEGDPIDEIVKLAQRVHADLVVVGHRERGVLARWWRTPVSMSLLDKLKCSVLIGMQDRFAAET